MLRAVLSIFSMCSDLKDPNLTPETHSPINGLGMGLQGSRHSYIILEVRLDSWSVNPNHGRLQFPFYEDTFSKAAFGAYKLYGKPVSLTLDASCVVFAFSRMQNEGVGVNCCACQPARGC